jgi:hypothetical protein
VANFTDPYVGGSASHYTASIDWGAGGTTAGVGRGSNGVYGVVGSHTYTQDGTYTLRATITDSGGGPSSASQWRGGMRT